MDEFGKYRPKNPMQAAISAGVVAGIVSFMFVRNLWEGLEFYRAILIGFGLGLALGIYTFNRMTEYVRRNNTDESIARDTEQELKRLHQRKEFQDLHGKILSGKRHRDRKGSRKRPKKG